MSSARTLSTTTPGWYLPVRNPAKDYLMRFVARATSAAPTYFEPAAKIESEEKLAFIDGAVFANNPTMCAFAHAMSIGYDEDEMTIISIGTGAVARELEYEEVRHWGMRLIGNLATFFAKAITSEFNLLCQACARLLTMPAQRR
ncbi:MAG: hypothetical protein EBT44_02175 [Actinobacteria bacterium]|uniref:PNPLA domain-containing protein n=1 Tax=Candidatus Fonsibacter lacus TaxID=2576439 RepID=A0A965GBZ3_9PROT|nr:hypothetical protein [Candidatus Fonsibacter lacus]